MRKAFADYQAVTVLKFCCLYTILPHFLTKDLPVKIAVVASETPALARPVNTNSAIPIDKGVLSTSR